MKLSLPRAILARYGEIARSPMFYMLVLLFAILGAVLGPFGAARELMFHERLWFSIETNLVVWPIAVAVAAPARLTVMHLTGNRFASILVSCLIAGIVVAPILGAILEYRLNYQAAWFDYFEYMLAFFALATIIAVISIQMSTIEIEVAAPADQVDAPTPRSHAPIILDRLPTAKRGKLLALRSQDHYVEIITDRGSELVLMRLQDAIDETGSIAGMKVHRSNWVALDAVKQVEREGRRTVARLDNGLFIAVARVNEDALRDRLADHALEGEPAPSY